MRHGLLPGQSGRPTSRARSLPREDRREEDDDGSGDAYLYLSESAPWPRTEGPELLERLPAL